MFYCEFRKICKNTFFYKTPLVANIREIEVKIKQKHLYLLERSLTPTEP